MNPSSRSPRLAAGLAVIALAFTACSSGSDQAQPQPTPAMPASADFIADVSAPDGSVMTMAISVMGDKVIGYATNGSDNQAYLFGTQKSGTMTLASEYGDALTGRFDGQSVTGELKIDGAASPMTFEAAQAQSPAGMYTVVDNGQRASWVVRKDRSVVGMMDDMCVAPYFENVLGNCRSNRKTSERPRPVPAMSVATMSATMEGKDMRPTKVTGAMSASTSAP